MLSRSAQRFLEELASEVGRSMSPSDAAAFMEEARGHLGESIQARLELGMSLEVAEQEAFASFGPAAAVKQEIRRREPWFDRNFAICSLAIAALLGVSFFVRGGVAQALLCVVAGLHVAYFVFSWKARRPQLWIFPLVILPLWFGTSFVFASRYTTVTWFAAGSRKPHIADRKYLGPAIASLDEAASRIEAAPQKWADEYRQYVKGKSDLAPAEVARFSPAAELALTPEANRVAGEAHWKAALGVGVRLAAAAAKNQRGFADAMREGEAQTMWQEFPRQVGRAYEAAMISQVLVVYLGGHLVGWSLGVWSRRRRKGREPRIMA